MFIYIILFLFCFVNRRRQKSYSFYRFFRTSDVALRHIFLRRACPCPTQIGMLLICGIFFCSPQVRRPEKNCPSEPVGRLTGGTEVFDSAKAGNGEKHVSIEAPFFGMACLRSRRKKSIETDGDTRKNPPSALKEKYGAALIGCTVYRMIRRSFAACGKLRSEFLCCL